MEIKTIIEAKTTLNKILENGKLQVSDFEDIKHILNTLYKMETNSKEINSAKISKTFRNILLLENVEIKELTNKVIKLWKSKINEEEKKSKKEVKDSLMEIKNQTDHINETSHEITINLDIDENSLNQEQSIKYFKQKIQIEERDPTRRNTKILIYDGFFKSAYVKSNQEYQIPDRIFKYTNDIEFYLYEATISTKDKYLKQTKAIVLNLYNNKEFVKEIFEGNITPERLSLMDPKEMASEEIKNKREKLKEEAFNARRSDWNFIHASTKPGIYRCRKCKSNRTTYNQAQIRRADEPMTIFITCLECTHSWKQ